MLHSEPGVIKQENDKGGSGNRLCIVIKGVRGFFLTVSYKGNKDKFH